MITRKLILLSLVWFISSCGAMVCLDSKIEREPRPIDGETVFELTFPDGETYTHIIKCEQYYDAQCTYRGNSWRIREVGLANDAKRSHIPLESENGNAYELTLIDCKRINKDDLNLTLKDFSIVWNKDGVEKTNYGSRWLGKTFRYIKTDESGVHHYRYGGTEETFSVKFSLKVDGTEIR